MTDGPQTTALAAPPDARYLALRSTLDRATPELAALLPRDLPVERVKRIAYNAIQNNPQLLDCTPQSFIGCVFTVAQLGLAPDSVAQHAHLIPRKIKGVDTVTLVVGYRGLMSLAMNSPHVARFDVPQIVYAGDEFEHVLGSYPSIKHRRMYAKPEVPIGAYAIVHLTNGGTVCCYMTRAEIEKVRNRVQGWQKGVWNHPVDYLQMWLKCPIRRVCKYIPQAIEASTAASLDELGEQALPQPLVYPPSLDVLPVAALPSADPTDAGFSPTAVRESLTGRGSGAGESSTPPVSPPTGPVPSPAPPVASAVPVPVESPESAEIVRTPNEIRQMIRDKMQQKLPPTCYAGLMAEIGFATREAVTNCTDVNQLLRLERVVEVEIMAHGARQVLVDEIVRDLGAIGPGWEQVLANLGFGNVDILRACTDREKIEKVAMHVKRAKNES